MHWLDRITAAGFGALLADDMGLGKTLTVIAYRLVRQDAGPSLVVCPASLVANWEREFARFAPGVTVRRYHALGRPLDGLVPGEVVVTTYGTLLRDAEVLADVPWDLVVADEAQQVKNHRSQAARALRLLRPARAGRGDGHAGRELPVGAVGDPRLDEPGAVRVPGRVPRTVRARRRAGGSRGRRPTVTRRAGSAGSSPRSSCAAARPTRTSPPNCPTRSSTTGTSTSPASRPASTRRPPPQALGRIAASDGLDRRGQVLRLLQSLRQICNSPAHYLRESPDGWDATAQAARSGKLRALDELMEDIVLAGDAALIFTGYVSMGHLIRAHLAARGIRRRLPPRRRPDRARQEIVDRFQSGDGDALILSVRAAGTGLNLTRAGHVIHFDRPWNPAVEDQATDRAHRLGQHRLVEVHHLITEGTVEDRIAELLARKRALTEAVLASRETALTELSDGELAALVSLGDRARRGWCRMSVDYVPLSADEPAQPDPRAWESWATPPGVPDKEQLELLAADAAGRAAAMLAGSATTTEDPLVDAVRLLATPAGAPHTAAAARHTGIPEDDLRRLVLAYRHGGTDGVAAALAATPCDPEAMAAAEGEVRRRRGFAVDELSTAPGEITDTSAGVRLRLGPDGRWYPFTLARMQWWPAPAPPPPPQPPTRLRSARGACAARTPDR